jgi:hypothetical protein
MNFKRHLSCKEAFKFLRHLTQALVINRMISMSDMYIHGAIFKLTRTWKRSWKRTWKRAWKRKWTWKRKRKLYLIRRNSPYSAVRIVANMSTAQFPMTAMYL